MKFNICNVSSRKILMVNCEILIVKQHAMVSFVIVDQVSINKKRHLQIKCSENRFNCEPNHERGPLGIILWQLETVEVIAGSSVFNYQMKAILT